MSLDQVAEKVFDNKAVVTIREFAARSFRFVTAPFRYAGACGIAITAGVMSGGAHARNFIRDYREGGKEAVDITNTVATFLGFISFMYLAIAAPFSKNAEPQSSEARQPEAATYQITPEEMALLNQNLESVRKSLGNNPNLERLLIRELEKTSSNEAVPVR